MTATASNLYAIPRHADGGIRVNFVKLVEGSGRNIIPEDTYMEVETHGETGEGAAVMQYEVIRITRLQRCMMLIAR